MATNEKIKLQGAAAYKKDLQQIAAQSKALAAEMKMVKSSFDKTTSAEEKNEAIGKQLTKQIELQKQRVDTLTKAYEEEVKVSGKQSEASAKAQEALFKGQEALNKMEQESRELAQAETELTQTEKEETAAVVENEGAHSRLSGVLKAAGVAIVAVGTAVVTAAKALWDATNAAGQWADNLITLSAQTDISTKTLQQWDYAARFIDVDVNTMAKGLQKIQSEQTKAISEKQKYIQILGGEKIALKDTNGQMKSTEQVFMESIDAIGKIKDETKRNAAAQNLFGKSFAELKPLIDAGSEGLQAYCDEAEALGLVLSDEDVGALGEFDDQMNKFKATMDVAGKELAITFLPQMKEVADTITELAQTITKALSDGFQDSDVDTILDAVFGKLSEGFNKTNKVLPAVQKFVSGLIEKLLEFAIKNLPTLAKTALEIVVGLANSLIEVVSQNFGLLLQAALDIVQSLANGLAENLPTLIPAIVEMIMTIITTLTDPENIDMLMQAAIALITGLADGLINAVPLIIERLPEIITNLVEGLIVEGVRLYQAAAPMINQLANGIAEAFKTLVTKVGGWVNTNIIQPIKEKGIEGLKEAGKNLVKGLMAGIQNSYEWIKSKISEWVGNVVDWFKAKFGVHSPSTVFMGIGENLAEGLAIGWKEGMSAVRSSMNTLPAVNGDFSADASPYGFGGSVINIYPQELDAGTMDYIFARVNARIGAAI